MSTEERFSFLKMKIQELQKQLADLINVQPQEQISQKSSQPSCDTHQKLRKILFIGTSRTIYLKPRPMANYFDIHSYRGASM